MSRGGGRGRTEAGEWRRGPARLVDLRQERTRKWDLAAGRTEGVVEDERLDGKPLKGIWEEGGKEAKAWVVRGWYHLDEERRRVGECGSANHAEAKEKDVDDARRTWGDEVIRSVRHDHPVAGHGEDDRREVDGAERQRHVEEAEGEAVEREEGLCNVDGDEDVRAIEAVCPLA